MPQLITELTLTSMDLVVVDRRQNETSGGKENSPDSYPQPGQRTQWDMYVCPYYKDSREKDSGDPVTKTDRTFATLGCAKEYGKTAYLRYRGAGM